MPIAPFKGPNPLNPIGRSPLQAQQDQARLHAAAMVRRGLISDAEFTAAQRKYAQSGHVYSLPLLNYRMGIWSGRGITSGDFTDLTTGKKLTGDEPRRRITAQLAEDARLEAARQAMPTAPVPVPAPEDQRRPMEATGAMTPVGKPEPYTGGPVYVMESEGAGPVTPAVGEASASTPALSTPVLIGLGVVAVILVMRGR